MYIASIRVQNYRCFLDVTVDFQPGLNVVIGENNAGKTTLLKALTLVFDRRGRGRPTCHDFNRLLEPLSAPPKIVVGVTLRSSPATDSDADRALVASWLTKLEPPWEATLTYKFFLPEQHRQEFEDALDGTVDRGAFFAVVEEFLPKYVSRVYGGNPDTMLAADAESLARFDCQFLDALRDVESEMFAGSAPLFRAMLEEVLDLQKSPEERRHLRREFRATSNKIRDGLVGRLDTNQLFELVNATGAADGGQPRLEGAVEEADLIAALRLFIAREKFTFPATHQGLGYNNLLYVSLMLASLSFRASHERRGENAAIFPMLLVEEPEAHLHPALQHKLLAHIVDRVEAEPQHNRQVFVTTHSTHVTAAARLGPIICLSIGRGGETRVCYPARQFPDTEDGRASRAYVERFLDATKSTMLFAKATLFVEGIAEQLVIPALAAALGRSLDLNHVALVRVDGLTFKHFLPLFGPGAAPTARDAGLDRRVACLVDADPARKRRGDPAPRWKACLPFECGYDAACDYRQTSGAVQVLLAYVDGSANVRVFQGRKTFEYDLAFANPGVEAIVTDAMKFSGDLRALAAGNGVHSNALAELLNADETAALDKIGDAGDRDRHAYAAVYLRCAEDAKGEHAFALGEAIRRAPRESPLAICPDHIREAIDWVTSSSESAAKE